MDNKKYAPLIGKKLTWEMLDALMRDIREDLTREQAARMRVRKTVKADARVHTEDDGA